MNIASFMNNHVHHVRVRQYCITPAFISDYIILQAVYVMPSTSGRAATFPRRADKLKFFIEVKELRDKLKRERELRREGEGEVFRTGQAGSETGQTGSETGQTGSETGQTGSDSGPTDCN